MKTIVNKTLKGHLSLCLFLFLPLSTTCFSQGTDVKYQGRLNVGPDPVV
jgi:hypothetical protein